MLNDSLKLTKIVRLLKSFFINHRELFPNMGRSLSANSRSFLQAFRLFTGLLNFFAKTLKMGVLFTDLEGMHSLCDPLINKFIFKKVSKKFFIAGGVSTAEFTSELISLIFRLKRTIEIQEKLIDPGLAIDLELDKMHEADMHGSPADARLQIAESNKRIQTIKKYSLISINRLLLKLRHLTKNPNSALSQNDVEFLTVVYRLFCWFKILSAGLNELDIQVSRIKTAKQLDSVINARNQAKSPVTEQKAKISKQTRGSTAVATSPKTEKPQNTRTKVEPKSKNLDLKQKLNSGYTPQPARFSKPEPEDFGIDVWDTTDDDPFWRSF
jgi:hypothetical protein